MTDLRHTNVGANSVSTDREQVAVWRVNVSARQPRIRGRAWWVGLVSLTLVSCGTEHPQSGAAKVEQTGEASWYGPGFHGKQTASGEVFDQNDMTAAHRTLPLGTKAEVTNVETGESVEVTINDRGPYAKGRVIDLSKAAAKEIGMAKDGTATVKIEANPARRAKGKKQPKEGEQAHGTSKEN
jgi:rare lipoprotein A (peptidoglycan hydrolase)